MSRTIVVPLRSSHLGTDRGDESVLSVVRVLALRTQAKVVFVSVVDDPAPFQSAVGLAPEPAVPEEDVARLVTLRRESLTQLAATLPGIDVDVEIRVGRPLDEILGLVGSLDHPILVMATSGRLGISRLLYGSVALATRSVSHFPIVLVHDPVPDPWRLDTVTVALDGSEFAEAALALTTEVLGLEAITLHLVHVIDYLSGVDLPAIQRRVAGYLDQVANRLIARGALVEWEIRTGAAAQELIRAAEERDAALIAMGSHGRSGINRLLLGSVAERVVHRSPIPVLLVRPHTGAAASPEPGEQQASGHQPTVADLMEQPAVTIREDATLEDAASVMLRQRVGGLPVVGPDGRLLGMLTESDFSVKDGRISLTATSDPSLPGARVAVGGITQRTYAPGRSLRVREFMSSPVVTVTEQETVAVAVERMRAHHITRLPVVREGRVIGIVTGHDLLKLLVSKRVETSEPP